MAPKSKSIYRQPGAQHFQVVHRSQRDPLINDPEASQHVLKPISRANDAKKGQTRADLEADLGLSVDGARENLGEATLYGVYYDDTEYDYMQHLRQAGIEEEGVDSVWLDAPSTSTSKAKGKGKGKGLTLKNDLPPEALPSTNELPMSTILASHEPIPSSISGLQPDMDPHLRQTLEALEDDAFIDEEAGDADDFFGELIGDGEREEDEDPQFEFREWGVEDEEEEEVEEIEVDEADWHARFAKFKQDQKANGTSEMDGYSEIADTVGTLPKLAVHGGKRRRTGTSDGSGFSLSSSAVYRNEGLTTLDERFDRLMAKEYDEILSDDDTPPPSSEEDEDEAPQLLSRPDINHLTNDFLQNFEIIGGRKLQQVMPGSTPMEKLDSMRGALGMEEVDKERIKKAVERQLRTKEKAIPMPVDVDEEKDRWDCETILSTYSNLENHPKLIRASNLTSKRGGPKFELDRKTGLPTVKESPPPAGEKKVRYEDDEDDSGTEESEDDAQPRRAAVGRPLNESKEDKRARKNAVKEEQQARRKEKKMKKELFAAERGRLIKIQAKVVVGVKPL